MQWEMESTGVRRKRRKRKVENRMGTGQRVPGSNPASDLHKLRDLVKGL